jgi:hypothetical protein
MPERRAVLQVVGKRVDISLEDEWGNRPPHTRIVAIGAHDTVDGEALRERFDRCLVETRQAAPAATLMMSGSPVGV